MQPQYKKWSLSLAEATVSWVFGVSPEWRKVDHSASVSFFNNQSTLQGILFIARLQYVKANDDVLLKLLVVCSSGCRACVIKARAIIVFWLHCFLFRWSGVVTELCCWIVVELLLNRLRSAHICVVFGATYCFVYNKSYTMWPCRLEVCTIRHPPVWTCIIMADKGLFSHRATDVPPPCCRWAWSIHGSSSQGFTAGAAGSCFMGIRHHTWGAAPLLCFTGRSVQLPLFDHQQEKPGGQL